MDMIYKIYHTEMRDYEKLWCTKIENVIAKKTLLTNQTINEPEQLKRNPMLLTVVASRHLLVGYDD